MKLSLEKYKKWLLHPLFFFLILPLSLLPSLYLTLHFAFKVHSFKDLEEKIAIVQKKSEALKWKTEEEGYFLKKLKSADPYYIDKYLESLSFLESDLKKLQTSDSTDNWSKNRLGFLKGGSNRLRFSEQNRKQLKGLQEVEEVQQNAVEMNTEDLKRVLARIEEVPIGNYLAGEHPPQMIIKNFELIKKEQEDVYLVNLTIIKRESSHE